ncbi:GNAT family N-acetyltransferase [Rhodovulum visakhapatnamense]|uniref:GNAT family acetyltransferase n=1 Tax=Rhodovulum visakhapatnamense TaxID=364297 RepID=A0A4R8G1T9_9RHOB|nr:GNAT family N-acetyltransferase [Rhodovulum visakhapatnamense]TDX33735.1 GNAT family acetyltransferase [Rhodovulum visakhapatnamense]
MGRSGLSFPRRRHLSARPRLRLRRARPGDGAPTRALFHDAVHRGASLSYSPEERDAWSPSPEAPADWEQKLLSRHTVIAEIRGAPVGFMTLGEDGYLDFAYVAPDWTGRGIGRALLQAILREARRAGLGRLSTEASLVARPFFARHGWRETARQSVIRHGVALTNFRMEIDI